MTDQERAKARHAMQVIGDHAANMLLVMNDLNEMSLDLREYSVGLQIAGVEVELSILMRAAQERYEQLEWE